MVWQDVWGEKAGASGGFEWRVGRSGVGGGVRRRERESFGECDGSTAGTGARRYSAGDEHADDYGAIGDVTGGDVAAYADGELTRGVGG